MIDKAERRLNNLGFFKSVKIWTEPGSAPDRVVVNVQVEDQSTGEISVGAGYSTTDGVIIELSITEKNLLGRGQFVRSLDRPGRERPDLRLRLHRALLPRPAHLRGHQRLPAPVRPGRRHDPSYDETLTGGALRFGIPINDELTLNLRYEGYNQDITDINDDVNDDGFVDSVNIIQPGESFISTIGYSLVYDTIDNKRYPLGRHFRLLRPGLRRCRWRRELPQDGGACGLLSRASGRLRPDRTRRAEGRPRVRDRRGPALHRPLPSGWREISAASRRKASVRATRRPATCSAASSSSPVRPRPSSRCGDPAGVRFSRARSSWMPHGVGRRQADCGGGRRCRSSRTVRRSAPRSVSAYSGSLRSACCGRTSPIPSSRRTRTRRRSSASPAARSSDA